MTDNREGIKVISAYHGTTQMGCNATESSEGLAEASLYLHHIIQLLLLLNLDSFLSLLPTPSEVLISTKYPTCQILLPHLLLKTPTSNYLFSRASAQGFSVNIPLGSWRFPWRIVMLGSLFPRSQDLMPSLWFSLLLWWGTSSTSFLRKGVQKINFFLKPVCLKKVLFPSHLIDNLVGYSLLCRK